jgi:N-acetylneuraminic acid mutarotase
MSFHSLARKARARLASILGPGGTRRQAPKARRRLTLEELENRFAPATFTWTGQAAAASGNLNWNGVGFVGTTPVFNWDAGVLPGAGDDVVIPSGAGSSIVDVPTIVHSLTIQPGYTGVIILANSLTVGGTLAVDGGTVLLNGQILGVNALTGTGTIANGATPAILAIGVAAGVSDTFTGAITGATTLNKSGAGTLTLGGSADNSGLGLTDFAGTVILGKTAPAGAAGVHAVNAGLTVDGGTVVSTGNDQIFDEAPVVVNGGTFDLDGQNETIGSLSGTGGTVLNSVPGSHATLAEHDRGAYAGVVQDGTGALTLQRAAPSFVVAAPLAAGREGASATLLPNGKVLIAGGLGGSATLASAELYDPATDIWTAAGSLNTARAYQTATLLGNGKVLVTGGITFAFNVLASAELYDPVANTWSSAGTMATERYQQTATLLGDGTVLVAGGTDNAGTVLASTEIYDPVSNSWSAGSLMIEPRAGATATALGIGREVLVAGGRSPVGTLASAEVYDYHSRIWTAVGSMLSARYGQMATLLPDGKVLIAGGTSGSSASGSAEIYDPLSFNWSPAGSMANARYGGELVSLRDGRVLVAGGTTATSTEIYDPSTNAWSLGSPLTDYRKNLTVTLLANGQVLVAGGSQAGRVLPTLTELFDPGQADAPGGWNDAASLLTARLGQTATLLTDGSVLVAGGTDANGTVLASAERYYPATNTWTALPPMPSPLEYHTATLLKDGNVLFAGGDGGGFDFNTYPFIYNPVTNLWLACGSMLELRAGHTATLLSDGKVLIAGGFVDNGGVTSSAELFDPATDLFSSAGMMSAARAFHTATLLGDGRVLVTGGEGSGASSAELYDPVTNTWSSAAPMAFARWQHTATLLGDGRVLVTGGQFDPQSTAGRAFAEIYDPVSNTWSTAASMASARSQHTATLLGDGQVLVTGGIGPADSELYNPYSNTWSSAGALDTPRRLQTATLLDNGKVLLVGGNVFSSTPTAEIYDPAGADPATSTLVVNPASVEVGDTAILTLTLRDAAGAPETRGGMNVSFEIKSGAGAANFAATLDVRDGTYTANVDTTRAGPIVIDATIDNEELQTALPTLTIVAPAPASQFVIDGLQTTSVTAGAALVFDVEALDAAGRRALNYVGNMHFTSTDGQATINNQALPAVVASNHGDQQITATFATAGVQTISVTDVQGHFSATSVPITVNPAPFSKYVVGVPAGGTVTAGEPFLFSVQATDAFGNPVSAYSGPLSASTNITPADPHGIFPITGSLDAAGVGYFLGRLETAGSYTLTAAVGATPATSATLTVAPATAAYFKVAAPNAATTGSAVNVTVTAYDAFGNVATGYSGHVHFTSTDSNALLPADGLLPGGVGIFSVTLNTSGSQTITAIDNAGSRATITGTSAAITTRGLVVTNFTPAADGFTITFSKAFDPSKLTLYGSGMSAVQDVTLVGAKNGPIPGTICVDPSNQSITFKATESYVESFFSTPVLPDDTYTVILVSGTTNGFGDGSGGLDGANNAGHANYTTTFTTANQSKTILSLPDFARGPDGAHNIQIPNDNGHGIPVTLTNATTVNATLFSLKYNPALLTVTGASSVDATTGGTLILVGMPTIIDATHATADFQYASTTPQSGTVVLGDMIATVPNSAAANYKAKELLTLTSITVNGSAFTGVAASAVHVNAYFGDVTGNGSIDALDVAFANSVAQGNATGFGAYPLLDPAIIGDVAGDISVDAGDVSTLAAYVSQLPTLKIPAIPTGLTITPAGSPRQ